MAYAQQDDGRQPTLKLGKYRIVFGLRKDLKATIWWPETMTTADARRHLDALYVAAIAYIEEVSQPPPAREKPSPHYRPVQSRLADPATYDSD